MDDVEPSDPDAQTLEYVDTVMAPTFKDPESMKIELVPDTFSVRTCSSGVVSSAADYQIYANGVSINAKNSYGGYTGATNYLVYFRDGEPFGHRKTRGAIDMTGKYLCPDEIVFGTG